jgi:hypothetical protein
MAQINPRTFADAKQLADGVYELILTNWGNRGQKQDPNNGSIQYPPIKSLPNGAIPIVPPNGIFLAPPIPSLTGIAISPRSDIDRCIVHFTPLQQTPSELSIVPPSSADPSDNIHIPIDEGFVNRGGQLLTEQIVSVDAPLIGRLVGPIIIRADVAHWFGDQIGTLGPGPDQLFGTAIPDPPFTTISGKLPVWTDPTLRLLLYFDPSPTPPRKRAPFHYSFSSISGDSNEHLAKVVPVAGRQRIRIAVQARIGADVYIRATGAFNTAFGLPNGGGIINYEVPLLASTLIPGNTGALFDLPMQPNVSFLLVYLTNFVAATELSIDAYD